MLVRQCLLESAADDGIRHLTAWLPERKDLKSGVFVTLKNSDDPERQWRVISVGQDTREQAEINTDWQVGGIAGRM